MAVPGAIRVGQEVVLTAPGGPGGTRRGKPAVAFGEDSYLVVWQDGWNGYGGSSRICALRVGLDGKALDPKPVEVAPAKAGVQENPRVAFFGGRFLVVWQDLRNGRDCDVLGARISVEGKVLDERPIAVAVAPRTQAMPDVAADDRGFMVVWHGFAGDDFRARVYARRVGANGALGQAKLLTVGARPRIAWNGKNHLVVYYKAESPGGGVKIAQIGTWLRMDTAGKLLPSRPPRRPLHWGGETPYQCSIGAQPEAKGWVIVSHGGAPNYWGRSVCFQRAVRVTADGQEDAPADDVSYPKKAPSNWLDTGMGTKSHAAVGANMPEIWPYGHSAVAIGGGQYCVAVWQRFHTGDATGMALINGDIRASRVNGWKPLDGAGGVAVAASPADELGPELAGDGKGRLLCVYEKDVEGRSSIAARTLRTR